MLDDWKGEGLIKSAPNKAKTEREARRRHAHEKKAEERKRVNRRRTEVKRMFETGMTPVETAKQLGEYDTLIYNDLKAVRGEA